MTTPERPTATNTAASRWAPCWSTPNCSPGRSPSRMLAAGIADAMAKYPEIDFSIRFVKAGDITIMPVSALQVAKSNTEKYFADAAESVRDVAAKRLTPSSTTSSSPTSR